MEDRLIRSASIYGEDSINKLKRSHVIIFGIGGVGGPIAESLVRTGIGEITLVDKDVVEESNINRQIIADYSTIGKDKVEVMKDKLLAINPSLIVHPVKCFYLKETKDQFDFTKYDYVIDAVDTVSAKIALVEEANKVGVPIISAMGAGNKVDITKLTISDIFKTEIDPLAKVMRYELRKRGIKKLKVVYSKEEPLTPLLDIDGKSALHPAPGSNSFVPNAMGLLIASEVVRDLTNEVARKELKR